MTQVQSISVEHVRFPSNTITIAANVFYPERNASDRKLAPAIVVAHPGGGVKEQTAGLYAQRLAAKGFVTLAFDAAYQGESEGLPRGLEDPAQRTEDIRSAVAFLGGLDGVDAARVGVLGICASGGYSIAAAASDHSIKALATVSGVDLGDWNRKGSDGNQDPQVIQNMLDAAAADRISTLQGNAPGTFSIRFTEEQARALGGINEEGWEYYSTDRAQHPRQTNAMTWSSVERIAAFHSLHTAHLIAPRPVLMIAGSAAQTLWMTREAYDAAREPKELFLIPGATHVALYDKDEYVSQAIPELDRFFKQHLAHAEQVH